MWADIIRGLLGGIWDIIKGIWGTDKPAKDTINDTPPTTPKPPPDDQLLRDLGVFDRPANRDEVRPSEGGDASRDSRK